MTSIATKQLTFAKFLEVCPEDGSYELVSGEIVKIDTIGAQKTVARLLLFS